MNLLTDARLFNYILMALYACAAIRWSWDREWWQALYWIGAIVILSAVTFGYQR